METEQEFRYVKSESSDRGKLKNSSLIIAVIGLMCAGAVIAIYWDNIQRTPSLLPPEVVAQLGNDGVESLGRLQREPCNRTTASELATQLIDHEEYSSVITLYESRVKQCGAIDELLPMVFTAQMGLSDFVAAQKTANSLVVAYPADPTSYGWRSQAKEKTGDITGAYADMQKALQLFPDPANVSGQTYYDTARLAAQAGHSCEAATIMRDYIAYDALNRRTQQISTLLKDWQRQGTCPSTFGVGSASIRYNKHDGAIIVPVEINGVLAHMIVDTGATMTLLTLDVANRAGIQSSENMGGEIITANGQAWVSGGNANSISLGNSSLKNVPVHIRGNNGSFGEGIDGLLGLSFLGNFQVHINDGTLELKPLE